jgi:MFS family permease
MNKPQLWTKDFLINSMENFLMCLVYYLLMVIIAVYAMDNLQASPSEAGLAAGIFIVASLFSRIFSGRAMEQVGRKKMLYIGLAVYALATLLYFRATNLPLLLMVRLLHGAGYGIATTATAMIVADIIPQERRGEGLSYFAMSTTLASAIGPFLGMYLYQHASFYTILILCVILLGVSYIAAFFLKVLETELTIEQLENMKRFTLNNFIECNALPIAFIIAVLCFSYSSIISFLSSYTKEINLIDAGSLFFIVYSAAMLISRPFIGRWFDANGENFVMYPSFLIFAIGLVILSQAHQGFILLVAGVFLGFGFGTFWSCGQAIAIKLSPDHRVGLATSTFYAIGETGIGIGPFFLGVLIPVIGFRGLYISMAGVVIISMCLYYFLHGRKAKHGEKLIQRTSM